MFLRKKSLCKWTYTVQAHVIRGSTVAREEVEGAARRRWVQGWEGREGQGIHHGPCPHGT